MITFFNKMQLCTIHTKNVAFFIQDIKKNNDIDKKEEFCLTFLFLDRMIYLEMVLIIFTV